MRPIYRTFYLFLAALLFTACGSDGSSDGGGAAPAQACSGQSDCPENYVCLTVAGESYCQPNCTGSADACGARATCGSVGALSIDVCQPEDDDSDNSGGGGMASGENAPKPDEQPKLPCATDADCEQFEAGAICAEFEGQRDCTIPCEQESDCDMPSIGGFSVDFLTCLPDEGDNSRSACVPDAACFSDPLSCVTLPSPADLCNGLPGCDDEGLPGSGDEDDDGFPGGGDGFPGGGDGEGDEGDDPFDGSGF